MLISAIQFSVILPIISHGLSALPVIIEKPFLVQATIDSARIIGLPSSKAANAYIKRLQMPDILVEQITYSPPPVSTRKFFFRSYFKKSPNFSGE